ncbi:alpha/beta hydrolase [uncultured Paraglaciecola sp.]|uniref:alpha/beta hydrolase family protein n=1 Tax=uncultured Paraglaciecola sp. TaxID=1765024 RepID=UPI0030D85110|tara:strand:- start:48638 stop:50065 length:1428 start_codon:yes stop_codon:yes gene_type:complete
MKRYLKTITATLFTSCITLTCLGESLASGAQSTLKSTPAEQSSAVKDALLFVGHWQGKLQVNDQQSIEFIFNFKQSSGGLVASLDVPSQSQFGLDFDEVNQKGNTISLALTAAGIQYAGQLVNGEIKGKYQQGEFKAPVTLVKTQTAALRKAKPQDPSTSPDYSVEQVVFKNHRDGHRLAGTLSIPRGPITHSVIILSGSGPTQRDGDVFGHKLYAVLADLLTKSGIAVLRFDDRGVGESEGVFTTATSKDFASDAEAALLFMNSHKELKQSKIGYVGHSEGSLIAAIALANTNYQTADFFVSLAGPSTSGAQILIDQSYLIQKVRGVASLKLNKDDQQQRQIIAAVSHNASPKELKILLAKSGLSPTQVDAQFAQLTSPWMQYFIKTDPKTFLAKVTVPSFVISGGKDLQVPAPQNIDGFIQTIDKQWLTYKIYPNLNHLLQPADKGLPAEYASIDTTLSPQVVKDIHLWLTQL